MDQKFKIQRSYYFRNSLKNDMYIESPWLRKRYKIEIDSSDEVSRIMSDLAQTTYFYKAEFLERLMRLGINKKKIELFFEKLYQFEIILEYVDSKWLENNRYSRQILFFENYEGKEISALDMQKKLDDVTVLIPGLGGYGSWLALLCTQMGIGNILLLDYDVVELTNLNRQVMYCEQDIGKAKVDVLKTRLSHLNSSLNIEGANIEIISMDSLKNVLKNVDIVYNSFGYFPKNSKYGKVTNYILDSSIEAEVDCFMFNGSFIGPIVNGNNVNKVDKFIQSEYMKKIRTYSIPNFKKTTGAIGPRLAFGSSIVAWETIRYLLFNHKLLLDNIIQLNTFDYGESKIINLNDF